LTNDISETIERLYMRRQLTVVLYGLLFLLGGNQVASAATLLFSDNFESGAFSQYTEHHGVGIVSSPVHGGSKALEFNYNKFGGGGETYLSIPQSKRLFISYWIYYPTGFDYHVAGGRHGWRLHSTSGQFDTSLWDSNTTWEVFGNCTPAGQCASYTLYGSVPTNYIGTSDQWVHMELDIQLNTTAGSSDGFLKAWKNGVQILNSTNQQFTNVDDSWNQISISTNDDNCGSGGSCSLYMDDWQMWDSNPGSGGGPLTLPPPANLRVQ
jgi:hypothetical protein